jgi:CDP-glucose 4,6-dehydratase
MSDFSWGGRRVFITGGTGFVGSHLTQTLKNLGADIRLLIHKKHSTILRGDSLRGDLVDDMAPLWLEGYLDMFQPEVVFHLAAQSIVCNTETDEMETMRTNVDGTLNILSASKSIKSIKSFVHIATDKVFGDTNLIKKDSALNGLKHPYNASKMIGDCLAQFYSNYFDIPIVIIRNANVYGEGDTHFDRIIPRTIEKVFRSGRPVVRGDGNNTRDYLYVKDIVYGYLRAAQLPYKSKLTTLNLGGFRHSVVEVVDTILMKMNRVDLSPVFETQWKGEIPHQHIENDLAKELIEWNPQTTLDAGLDKTIPWYLEYLNGKS